MVEWLGFGDISRLIQTGHYFQVRCIFRSFIIQFYGVAIKALPPKIISSKCLKVSFDIMEIPFYLVSRVDMN